MHYEKKRKNTCKRDFFLINLVENVSTQVFLSIPKKRKKKKKKNCTKSNVSLQIQSNNEK